MHNIPISYKLQTYYRSGNVQGLSTLFQKYAFVIHPPKTLPIHSSLIQVVPPSNQLEIYEILLADYLSRKYWLQYYLVQHTDVLKKTARSRSVVLVGPDASLSQELYEQVRDGLESKYRKRYYGKYVDKGLSAAISYRAGYCYGMLSATPYPDRNIAEYRHVLEGLQIRTIDSKKRAFRDTAAYDLGFKDGVVAALE